MTLEQWLRNRYQIVDMDVGIGVFEFIVWGNKLAETNFGIFTKLSFFVSVYEDKVDMSGTDEEILIGLQNGDPDNIYGYEGLIV